MKLNASPSPCTHTVTQSYSHTYTHNCKHKHTKTHLQTHTHTHTLTHIHMHTCYEYLITSIIYPLFRSMAFADFCSSIFLLVIVLYPVDNGPPNGLLGEFLCRILFSQYILFVFAAISCFRGEKSRLQYNLLYTLEKPGHSFPVF